MDGTSYILIVSSPSDNRLPALSEPLTLCTPLSVYQSLLGLLSQHTSIPHPTPLHHSDTLAIIPHEYLILTYTHGVPLSDLRRAGKLSDRQNMLIDLQIGRWMREMHDKVQNDWFGLPKVQVPESAIASFSIPGLASLVFGQTQEEEPSYSWQETFTSSLESLMQSAEALGLAPDVSYTDLRQYLGRAIGSFLFDDCDVPSLISFLGDDGSVIVDMPQSQPEAAAAADTEPRITSLLPPTYALYGDPLLETFFLQSGGDDGTSAPSQALLEGYGGNPIVFRRQKTKRIWYDAFLCLAILLAARSEIGDGDREAKVWWARQRIRECVNILKDAPTY